MILLDAPYVSDFLLETINENKYHVLNNTYTAEILKKQIPSLLNDEEAKRIIAQKSEYLYTNSENSIEWILNNLTETRYPEWIQMFKDKARFRALVAKLYPEVYFKKIVWSELKKQDIETLPFPLVVKPTVGFFSLGVHIVHNAPEWQEALESLEADMHRMQEMYPEQVLNVSDFIIESYIQGEEYAFDCYFNEQGNPVILTILKHVFSSETDVSDRLYMTSTAIMAEMKDEVAAFLLELKELTGLKNFPLHVEIRMHQGKITPIEVNPLRFGGWCTTADLTWHAYGFNPYSYFFEQKIPDWDTIINRKDRSTYSIIILDIPASHRNKKITGFDYEKLITQFEDPLELRKIDFHKHPVFGFLFSRTSPGNSEELDAILKDDLTDYIVA